MKESQTMNYEQQMLLAIEAAKQNSKAPFGTVLFDTGIQEVVASGVNHVRLNPLLHGEIDAINHYAEKGQNNWNQLILFTTAEPCCMCQAAIIWAGITKVVFGTSVESLSRFGWNQFDLSAKQVASAAEFANCEIVGGVLESKCNQLFENVKR